MNLNRCVKNMTNMKKLKVLWVGYGGNSFMAEELRPIINELGMGLITIHEHDNADIKWDKDTWFDHLKKADIIICPANYKIQPAKSANRLTQGMSMGKSIICSPLLAYLDVAKKHPGSFLLADSPEEWKEKLKLLRDTPLFRDQLGKRALKAAQDYSLDAIGEKWEKVLQDTLKTAPVDDRVSVDIIIPTYKNLRGLKHCLDSIRHCTTVPYRIIVVNNGDDDEMYQYLESQSDVIHKKIGKSTFAQAVNKGIDISVLDASADSIMILNDDVIVSKNWLKNMIEVCIPEVCPQCEGEGFSYRTPHSDLPKEAKHGEVCDNCRGSGFLKTGAVGLFSNCDKGWRHSYDINIGGVDLVPGVNTFEQIEPIIPQIYEYKSPYTEVMEVDWVAFYATLIPMSVVHEVGRLDETFENSGEDTDYCSRIRKLNYKIVQVFKSFAFHFGAVSRKTLENENYEEYHKADNRTTSYLNLKYSKPTVVIYSGQSWEKWDFRNLEQGGIGGSETWQIWVSRELSKIGYRVINFNDLPELEMQDGDVKWYHYSHYPKFIEQNYIDFFISSRTADSLDHPIRSGKNYVLSHDIWLLSDRNKIHIDKVTKYAALSEWHKKFISDYHNIPMDKIILTANGIDFLRYDNKNIERHLYRMFWSSSLDRGLDTLLYLFPFIKERIPELELNIYYGMDVWEKAVKQRNNVEGLRKIEEIKEAMKRPGISYHGRINQKELAEAQLSSSLWAYSTDFEESFCITAIEAQRAGVPIVATNYAGLQTTIGDSGILIGNGNKGQSYTKEYREKFVEECISILKDRDKWLHWSEKGFKNTEKYSWAQVAQMWKKLFEE